MKMISLRSLASIAVFSLMLANWASGESFAADTNKRSLKTGAPAADGLGKISEGEAPDSEVKATESDSEKSTDKADKADRAGNTDEAAKADKTKKEKKDKKAKEDTAADESDKGSKEKEKKTKVEAPSAAELKAQAAAAERAKLLKLESTPFNTSSNESASQQDTLAPLTLRSTGGSLRTRLVPIRVYLPPKMIIGKPAEFVVKGRAGSHVAVAMADKDSGAKPVQGHNLRLGADRKLMAAGVIPESGILTLIVDMPIQGDLIGLPVFFETAIWQKPDFSDVELAAPVKSETIAEFADKPNAVVVQGEIGAKGRGLKLDSAVPLHQRGNVSLESGRP